VTRGFAFVRHRAEGFSRGGRRLGAQQVALRLGHLREGAGVRREIQVPHQGARPPQELAPARGLHRLRRIGRRLEQPRGERLEKRGRVRQRRVHRASQRDARRLVVVLAKAGENDGDERRRGIGIGELAGRRGIAHAAPRLQTLGERPPGRARHERLHRRRSG
jgi:hypothetical protein